MMDKADIPLYSLDKEQVHDPEQKTFWLALPRFSEILMSVLVASCFLSTTKALFITYKGCVLPYKDCVLPYKDCVLPLSERYADAIRLLQPTLLWVPFGSV